MTTPDPDATARIDSDARFTPRHQGEDQFAPGTFIAGRYRIASLLGSGGMGEVYRADDTKLGQTVALKFLPARLARDSVLLQRLHDEVRLGRQIAHPNVCRIYDIVDWEGAHFVAMEYVDGEDLSRLLRRIGRLAHDKAVDIARGIAAGLMAAHAKGILHRDLKPANVMIDSRGDARIMDFGLALAAGEDDGTISGTPAYMAPEQLEGKPATAQSDLYALGLVMYELFTGKRAHNARTLPERVRDLDSNITTPSDVVRDIDPAVERTILRCLAHDPSQRPHSARQVIESLPGGDPLAAALAAGETPSPRIVAAAGTEGSLKPAVAWALLLAILGIVTMCLVLTTRSGYWRRSGLGRPPDVQAEHATNLLRGFGIPQQQFRAYGFADDQSAEPHRFQHLGRGISILRFWLREEPAPILDRGLLHTPQPDIDAPPQYAPGSITMILDPRGRLLSLRVHPTSDWSARPLDWNALLRTAGLDPARFTATAPKLVPPAFADARAAWSGRYPEDNTPVRVEAASYQGVPVFFNIIAPWDEKAAKPFFSDAGFMFAALIASIIAIGLGTLLAWRNLRLRRGDRQGAWRMAVALFIIIFISTIAVAAHELVLFHELSILSIAVGDALFAATFAWLIYIAIEPHIRRRFPQGLISWTRLMRGDWRDPMVGRDVLIGIAAGLGHAFLAQSMRMVRTGVFAPGDARQFNGALLPIARITTVLQEGILEGLIFMIGLTLLLIVLRRRLFAAIGVFALMLTVFLFASTELPMVLQFILISALIAFVVARYGLLAMMSFQTAFHIGLHSVMPDALDWYTARAIVPILFLAALAIWAFRTALGNQRAFAFSLDE